MSEGVNEKTEFSLKKLNKKSILPAQIISPNLGLDNLEKGGTERKLLDFKQVNKELENQKDSSQYQESQEKFQEEEDSSLFDYDSYYEKEKKLTTKSAKSNSKNKISYGLNLFCDREDNNESRKKSNYIEKMKKIAMERQIENEMAIERKIHRENEQKVNDDTEIFITPEYKKKLEQRKEIEKKLSKESQVHHQDMNAFYSNIKNNISLGGKNRDDDGDSKLIDTDNQDLNLVTPSMKNYYDPEYKKSSRFRSLFGTSSNEGTSKHEERDYRKPQRNDEASISAFRERYLLRKPQLIAMQTPLNA